MKLIKVIVLLMCAISHNSYADDIEVTADLNDYKALESPVKSFNATHLTKGQLQNKMGSIQKHQVIGIWCEGKGMGDLGQSAFDVIKGDSLTDNVLKLGANRRMMLTTLCKKDLEDFVRKHR